MRVPGRVRGKDGGDGDGRTMEACSRRGSTGLPAALPSESQRPPATAVRITVVKAQDLRAIKSEVSATLVCVEYKGSILGDSSKADVSPDGTAKYNFECSFECSPAGPITLQDLAQQPVLLTVIEVLQKDKKQKDKTMPLGQAVVDLLPLLQGQCSLKVSAPLYAVPASPSESLQPEAKGGLEVIVCTSEPLLSAAQISSGNLLSITLEAAYSIPEAFASAGPLQNYIAGLQVPVPGEQDFPLVFKNGILKLAGEKEPLPRPRKWPLDNILAPGALSIPSSFILGGPFEDEDGELNKPEDREFRTQAESRKRIVWDVERRWYLDAAAPAPSTCLCLVPAPSQCPSCAFSLQQHILECQYWPVELCRVALASPSKGKSSKADKGDEDKQISFHGVAYVNMVPLLCPGVKCIRGAFPVCSYQDSQVLEKTKRQHSAFQDLRTQLSLNKEGSLTPGTGSPSKAQKEDKDAADLYLHAQTFMLPDMALGSTTLREQCLSPQQYAEAGTFLLLEIKMDKALVARRSHEELSRRIKEMIPPRPPLPPRTSGAKKAVEDYHNHVTSIAVSILEEYQELFGKQLPEQEAIDHQTLEDQKHQLCFELNISGKYFAFKEQLKYAVVNIVREKYLKTTGFESQEQLQAFLSELYVYLVQQMHIALNQLLFEEPAPPAPPSHTTQEQLWLCAREAEFNKDYKLASLYHQQRVAQDQHNAQHWLDYGIFCLLLQDAAKAQQCFQQALSLDPHNVQSLLLCGIVAVTLQHYEEAEIFFEDACCLEPSSVVAWTLSGLFFELQTNDIQAEMDFREAKKLLQAQERSSSEAAEGEGGQKDISDGCLRSPSPAPEECIPDGSADKLPKVVEPALACATSKEGTTAPEAAPGAPPPGSAPGQAPCSIFMKAVEFLLKVNAVQFAHRALAHELLILQGRPSCAYCLALAQTYLLKEDLPRCEECLCEATKIDYINPNIWAQKGHLSYLRMDFGKAKECYERAISFQQDPEDVHFVYLHLGSIYLEEKEYCHAKQTYLLACKSSATCLTWLGVGISCYRLGELVEAEAALSEANAINNSNAEVWGYLTLICLQRGRELEAEQCYKYTLKLGLSNAALLREIHDTQHQLGFGNPSL
ncbi:cilia- and flagella-associated protein 70 [Indicator indicator]|uniref:cilia- and flagella-associated protein 70 n=1 Tax=Indicator indicator TaxID=1002788 RepID=UPI0023DF28AD|nr:cilia- and flagella-associated protein 70 [Indicator indicator]